MEQHQLYSKICTTREQSKRLIELGLNTLTADMTWKDNVPECKPYGRNLNMKLFSTRNEYTYPAWSLNALLKLMPYEIIHNHNTIQFQLYPQPDNNKWNCLYIKTQPLTTGPIPYFGSILSFDDPIDAVFETLCKLLKHNYINIKENEND